MSSPSFVFPSPPTSMPPPPPPPLSPPSASSEKKETLLFELEVKQVRLLQRALRSLVLTASCPDGLSLAGTGKIPDSGNFYISADGAFLVAKSILPPAVDTCLALERFATFDVPSARVLCLNLRLLEQKMASTVVGDGEGLTLCFKGEKVDELIYSLKQENDNVVHSSVIPVIYSYFGGRMGLDWSGLEDSFVLSFLIPVQHFNQVLGLTAGSSVHITVTETSVKFQVENENVQEIVFLRRRVNQYQILNRVREYPFQMEFSLHQRDAILNAVALSDDVVFHQTLDSRCVLEIPVNGLGRIHFCFDAN